MHWQDKFMLVQTRPGQNHMYPENPDLEHKINATFRCLPLRAGLSSLVSTTVIAAACRASFAQRGQGPLQSPLTLASCQPPDG